MINNIDAFCFSSFKYCPTPGMIKDNTPFAKAFFCIISPIIVYG